MQFGTIVSFITMLAATGFAMAAPSDNTQADQSAALNHLLTNSPAGDQAAAKNGPATPGCYWSGTAPFCSGSCENGEIERGRGSCGDGQCCYSGYKALCCKN